MLSRNFADENGLLHCYRKQDNKAFQATPANVFARNRLYSKRGGDGAREDPSKELVLEDPMQAFIIGDDPMIPPGATLNHADAADLFPIARDVAVASSGGSFDEELALLPKGANGALRNINLAILEQSSTVAGPSERLIESLRPDRR